MKLAVKALFLASLTGCAAVAQGPVVPASLTPPADQVLSTEAQATGVQIYACTESKPGHFEWVFKAPEADLFDREGRRIGRHYAGPTWEGVDGSKVIGMIKSRNDAPDQNAIPWLLLNAKANEGKGLFAQVESIQRVNTSAGKAPSQACDRSQLGKVARVDYRATYYFYSSKA